MLRHSLATHMLQKGASLAEIGEVLRHRCPITTELYSKVDLAHCTRWLNRGRRRDMSLSKALKDYLVCATALDSR